jgi:hypothetical protein
LSSGAAPAGVAGFGFPNLSEGALPHRDTPADRIRTEPSWCDAISAMKRTLLAPLFALAAVVLLPWIVLLAVTLPSTHRAERWDVAWVGFDAMLALLLLAVAIAAWRRSNWLEGAASAAATLLFVDAWFDVLTSSTRAELVTAIVEALVVELPLAVACLLVARSAKRRLRLQPIALVPQQTEPFAAVDSGRRAA